MMKQILLLAFAGLALSLPSLFTPYSGSLNAEQQRLLDRWTKSSVVSDIRIVKGDSSLLLSSRGTPFTLVASGINVPAIPLSNGEVVFRNNGLVSWTSESTGDVTTFANMVINGEQVTGTVRTGRLFLSIRPMGEGVHALIVNDETRFPAELVPLVDNSADRIPKSIFDDAPNNTTISVIVAYSNDADDEVNDMAGYIQLAVDETNMQYRNSDVSLTLELDFFYHTNYDDSGSQSVDLSRFRTKNDGYMDEIHTYRSQYRSNMAALITAPAGACGVASAIYASESTAFMTGTTDCCVGYYTFGHELGHLQGARHDLATDPSRSPFTYGHGYIIASRLYRTVMAYNINGETRVPYWSNPGITYQGYVTGTTADADNSRVLDETGATVARWCSGGC